MKKIAFFVEGPTEADFVKAYLKEVTSQRGLITVKEFTGGKSSTRVYTQTYSDNAGSDYMVDIYVSGADNRVNSDILDNLPSLVASGFAAAVGLRDLRGQKTDGSMFSLADLAGVERASHRIFAGKNPPVHSVIAVMEIETWFMAETNHYPVIDPSLTQALITSNAGSLGVNPYIDDLTQVAQPAETLNDIYHLAGKAYSKDAAHRQRTINALDYANLYVNVPARLVKFDEFKRIVDSLL